MDYQGPATVDSVMEVDRSCGMGPSNIAQVVGLGFSVEFRGRSDLPRQPRFVSSGGDSLDIRRQEGRRVSQWTIGVISEPTQHLQWSEQRRQ